MFEQTPAAQLRAAADKLRQAAAAGAGPWQSMPDVQIGGWAVALAGTDKEGPYLADFVHEENANYIALMHPAVGLAVAGWLEQAARTHDAAVQAAGQVFHDDPVGRDAWVAEQTDVHALAVARAVLGAAE